MKILQQCGDDLTRENIMRAGGQSEERHRQPVAARHGHQHLADRLSHQQADADDEVQRRALGTVRPDHRGCRTCRLSRDALIRDRTNCRRSRSSRRRRICFRRSQRSPSVRVARCVILRLAGTDGVVFEQSSADAFALARACRRCVALLPVGSPCIATWLPPLLWQRRRRTGPNEACGKIIGSIINTRGTQHNEEEYFPSGSPARRSRLRCRHRRLTRRRNTTPARPTPRSRSARPIHSVAPPPPMPRSARPRRPISR